jgi:hypothetical protein
LNTWTFVHCGVYGKPEGFYDERYTQAAIRRLGEMGRRVEFVTDDDMPKALRYRGSWGMLALYNPELEIGNDDGVIYAAGLDTVFLRDIERIEHGLDATGADIAGSRCPSDGHFNTMVLRIRRGSESARAVWDAVSANGFNYKKPAVEHKLVRRFSPSVGIMENGIVSSYKVQTARFPATHTGHWSVSDLSALVFHGFPKPHEVCEDAEQFELHDVVMEHWGVYAGSGAHGCKARLAC